MLLSRKRTEGNCFAWLPKNTPEGRVWLERVHYHLIEGWGWGSDSTWAYTRWIPDREYDAGKRETWDAEQARLHKSDPQGYATPPDVSKCRNFNSYGTTACWYPHCSCMNVGGTKCPG
jgi:hypothetical protein